MKKFMRILVPLLIAAVIVGSIGWYLFVYDRGFTRDVLLEQARYQDLNGNSRLSSWFYNMAYLQSGQDPNVAIELANQYIRGGNYTKAEVTLTNAIHRGPTAELYCALSRVYVEQDKLMDAIALLENLPDSEIKTQLEERRPAAPAFSPEPGTYTERISVTLSSEEGKIYYSLDGEFPSVADPAFSEPVSLDVGETKIHAVTVSDEGLVSRISAATFTVGGIVEPVEFADPAVELSLRTLLSLGAETTVYTSDLWGVTDFTLPEDAATVEDVAKLPYLKSLTVDGKTLDTLEPLAGLTRLTQLSLTHCKFPAGDIAIIASLPELHSLTLSDCSLSTIAGLENAVNLTSLDLSNNTIRNLEPLTGLTGMTELKMAHNALTSLSALSNMGALGTLDVSYNAITSLSPLSSCILLSDVDASHNRLTGVEGVSSLPTLTKLRLDSNALTDVSPLAQVTTLTELRFSNNQITEMDALSSLTGLELLDFSYNSVENLPQWSGDLKLRVIDGSHNVLTSVDVLQNAADLTYVYMDYNQLTSLDALAELYHLVQVNAFGNEIESVSRLTEHNIIVNYDPT